MSGSRPTVGDLVTLGALRTPDRDALREADGRSRTYAELDGRTNRLAQALLGLGLSPGDRVAAWMADRIEYVELYLAAAKAGLVMVPINARLRSGEAAHLLTDSDARLLFFSDGIAGSVEELGDAAPDLVSVGDAVGPARHEFERLVSAGAESRPAPPHPDAPYVIGYTSGTTGRPKGAVMTHRSVMAIAGMNALSTRLPMFSIAAATGSMSFVATVPAIYLAHLYVGGTVLMLGRWDAESLLATIESERVTYTYLPTPTIDEFVDLAAAEPRRWASLVSVVHSASKASPQKLRALSEAIDHRLVEGLGMTENSGGLVTATTRADMQGHGEAQDVFASVGRPVAATAIEVLGADGTPLERDGATVGELAIRSPALVDGYWNMPDESAAAFRDGWYRTGDLGSIDPAGYVYVVERRTDLIVSGGINVYPSEVEAFINAIPGVAESAVFGVEHERWGQAVAAAVVRDGSRELSAEDVIASCRDGMASFKKPTSVFFLDELPRTASLKVRRSEVRKMLS